MSKMLKNILFSVILSMLALNVSCGSDVLEYTDANFDAKIRSHDIALVEVKKNYFLKTHTMFSIFSYKKKT